MSSRPGFALATSRIICVAGMSISILVAVALGLTAIALALGWPQVLVEAAEKGMTARIAGLQPWLSLVLVGATTILALTAAVFRDLLAVLDGVSHGDPFTADSSLRLRRIGWIILGIQGAGFLTGLAGHAIARHTDIGASFEFSFTGLLAALLAFVLAEVFEQARHLRDDLEGTV